MLENNILDKIVDNIKKITGNEKLDDSKISTKIDDKLPDHITLKML